MFDMIAVEAGTMAPIGEAKDLKLDQVLRNVGVLLAKVAREDKEIEIAIRKHKA